MATRRLAAILVAGLLAILAAAGTAGAFAWRELHQPAARAADLRIDVASGTTLRRLLADLAARGLIRHPRLLELYARGEGAFPLQTGAYLLRAHESALEWLDDLRHGRVLYEELTVIEGWNFAQMRAAIDADADLAHTLRGADAARIMTAIGHPELAAEGRFFPDTYRFAVGTADRRIYELAFERMERELADAWASRAMDLPLRSPSEVLTFASIVEKETGRADERPRVAAVFANRLRLGMRLQSDPTVIYGLGDRYDGDLHRRDLDGDTPYNTYTRAGLPPTPIALPGAAALAAATHPAAIDALYFVATGNGDGSHHFSATLAEHNAAVQRFVARLRAGGAGR